MNKFLIILESTIFIISSISAIFSFISFDNSTSDNFEPCYKPGLSINSINITSTCQMTLVNCSDHNRCIQYLETGFFQQGCTDQTKIIDNKIERQIYYYILFTLIFINIINISDHAKVITTWIFLAELIFFIVFTSVSESKFGFKKDQIGCSRSGNIGITSWRFNTDKDWSFWLLVPIFSYDLIYVCIRCQIGYKKIVDDGKKMAMGVQ